MNKKVEEGVKYAKSSLEVEGFTVKEEHEELVKKRLNKEITEEEFIKQAEEKSRRGKK